jgi:UDP-glucose 4-epimerase
MNVLITGASGFIGSYLIEALKDKRFTIRLLARKKYLNYETFICDLGTEKIPEEALDSIDIVFHLAGYAHDETDSSIKDSLYYNLNVKATEELFEISAKKGVKNFIYLSSVKAGGVSSSNRHMTESDQADPKDIYGVTKRKAELKILDLNRYYNINISIIRSALVYGNQMKGNLLSMLDGIKKGWFPPIPETNNIRSMICVSDLVNAIIILGLKPQPGNSIFIVTDGYQYSTRDIYKSLCYLAEKKVPRWSIPKIIFYTLALCGDVFKFIPFNSNKYNKLFSSEFYYSEKLNKLGFVPKYNLMSYFEDWHSK